MNDQTQQIRATEAAPEAQRKILIRAPAVLPDQITAAERQAEAAVKELQHAAAIPALIITDLHTAEDQTQDQTAQA